MQVSHCSADSGTVPNARLSSSTWTTATCNSADSATAPHSHDDLFHTLLGLTDVRTSLYQPDHDIFLTCRAGQ